MSEVPLQGNIVIHTNTAATYPCQSASLHPRRAPLPSLSLSLSPESPLKGRAFPLPDNFCQGGRVVERHPIPPRFTTECGNAKGSVFVNLRNLGNFEDWANCFRCRDFLRHESSRLPIPEPASALSHARHVCLSLDVSLSRSLSLTYNAFPACSEFDGLSTTECYAAPETCSSFEGVERLR